MFGQDQASQVLNSADVGNELVLAGGHNISHAGGAVVHQVRHDDVIDADQIATGLLGWDGYRLPIDGKQ
ncbi:hypothetical protein GCM10007392_05440 [Saccharospirillum salsuginis]|uniref:Uncharacterized protein n=1 Tax=Saccharospirillum salsuginis TaxID=418750 RepID=A0A918N6Y3_9GAMM|nr:hypothetical protein GCM10007392_05440 [Saccharospirillum salsuginis]